MYILYTLIGFICAGVSYYVMPRLDGEKEKDIVGIILALMMGFMWPIAIIIGVLWLVFWLLGFPVRWIAKICALVDGFIHGIGRDNGKNY